jgi:uncharacterized protein (TIRG00374 family)
VSRFALRLLLGLALGAAVVVGFSLFADVRRLIEHLGAFTPALILPVLGLTLANYALRFVKWHYLLGRAGVEVSRGHSLLVFLSGFSMGITPGKLGELIKSYLLRLSHGVPMTRTAPVVIAERIADLLALLVLSLAGIFTYASDGRIRGLLLVCGLFVIGMTAVLASQRLLEGLARALGRVRPLAGVARRLVDFAHPMAALLTPVPLLLNTLLSLAAWLCECVGFYLVIQALPGAAAPLTLAVFIYAATTILGALSFLPGGLGVTEGSMTLLLVKLASGLTRSAAIAATLVIRLCTLWFAVVVGLLALLFFRFRLAARLDLDRMSRPEEPASGPAQQR